MTERPPLVHALQALLGFLDRDDVPSMLMGGLAIRTLAIPRPTFDLDLMVAADESGVADFARAAQREGFSVDDPHLRGFADRVEISLRIPAGDRLVPADVFLSETDYQRAAFARRRRNETELGPCG